MTAPDMTPTWLELSSVTDWLQLAPGTDSAVIGRCCSATEPLIERARPELLVSGVYAPTPDVLQAAIMTAAKLYRRRLSPGGLEAFADTVSYVARFDPEVERLLRIGAWRPGRAR